MNWNNSFHIFQFKITSTKQFDHFRKVIVFLLIKSIKLRVATVCRFVSIFKGLALAGSFIFCKGQSIIWIYYNILQEDSLLRD